MVMNRDNHGETPIGGRKVTPVAIVMATLATVSAVLSGFVSADASTAPLAHQAAPKVQVVQLPDLSTLSSSAPAPAAAPPVAKTVAPVRPRVVHAAPRKLAAAPHPAAAQPAQTVAHPRVVNYTPPRSRVRDTARSDGRAPRHQTPPAVHKAPTKSAPSPITTESSIASAVFSAVNASRAQHGLPALRADSRLVHSAHEHNLAMAHANEMSHQLPGEPDLGARLDAAGVPWTDAAENLGWCVDNSTNAALLLHKIMMGEGPPPAGQSNHYSNILDPAMHYLGVDVIWDSVHSKMWLTEDFANV
jgi:uncharacterized protein YkwD